jgi:hypothetical protein
MCLLPAACSAEQTDGAVSQKVAALSSSGPSFTVVGQTDTGFLPPDSHGAVSASFVVTTVNNTINLKNRSGTVLLSESLSTFWAPLGPSNLTDPQVHFDPFAQRFIVSEADAFETPNGRLLLAVSQTPDPTGAFFFFTEPASPGGHTWLDFPQTGFNKKWIVVTGNFAATDSSGFVGEGAWLFDKTALYAGGPATFTFINMGINATSTPADTYDDATEDLFACRSSGTDGGAVDLLRFSGPIGAETLTLVATVPSPLPTKVLSADFTLPQAGGMPTSFVFIAGSTGFVEPTCVFRNGAIWTVQGVFPADGPTRLAAQWLQLDTTGAVLDVGRVDDPTGNASFWKSSIAANRNDDLIVGSTRFAGDSFPSAVYALHLAGDAAGTTRDPFVYQAGAGAYTLSRWGDYSHSQVDPVNDTDFWTIQETTQAADSWATWWAEVPATQTTTACTEASAIDLGAPANAVTVPDNACLRVRDGYPFWWGTRTMQLQDMSPGTYPVPFIWSNTCSGGAGSDTFTGDWQTKLLSPTSSSCATLIQLQGSGSGTIMLRYFG